MEVNGKNVSLSPSVVRGAASGKLVSNIDTGTSYGWIPKPLVEAIYKDLPGARYYPDTELYTVPCLSQIRLAFWFGGVRYPVHPSDVTTVQSATDSKGNPTFLCVNTFYYTPALALQSSALDLQLGDSFLRNVVAQYDFGDLVDPKTANIKMVTTLPDELTAMNDFLKERAAATNQPAPPPVTELPGGSTTPANPPPGSSTDTPPPTRPPGAPANPNSSDSDPSSQSPEQNPDQPAGGNGAGRLVPALAVVLAPFVAALL